MTEATVVAVLGVLGALGAAALTFLTASQVSTWRRLARAEATNQSLWTYTRVLIDAHYRAGLGEPPAPPAHIRHLYEYGDST